jgi:N-methylhydantoinase A
VKAVSTYRGRDPRDFTLFGFGGNGPVLATEIANMLEMERIIIPMNPGVFSAYGLLRSPIEHEVTQSFLKLMSDAKDGSMAALVKSLEKQLLDFMKEEGCEPSQVEVKRFADLRYYGQAHELTVPLTLLPSGEIDFEATAEAFHVEHDRTYGHRSNGSPIQSVNVRVLGTVHRADAAKIDVEGALDASRRKANKTVRQVYFGPAFGHVETPILCRADLGATPRSGPMILEEYDTTCVVPPNWNASIDASGNIILTTTGAAQ